jgi:hypothetical protein
VKVAVINTDVRRFFYHWVTVTYPIHKLGKMDKAALSELLYYRYKFSLEIDNEEFVQKMLFDYDTKLQIAENLKINQGRFAMILTSLRKKGIIKGRTLNVNYTPGLKEGDKEFTFAYRFKLSDNGYQTEDSEANDANSK